MLVCCIILSGIVKIKSKMTLSLCQQKSLKTVSYI